MMRIKKNGNNESGDYAGNKEFTYRLFGDDAEDDKKTVGGMIGAQRADAGNNSCRKPLIIAVAVHLGDGNTRKSGRGRSA